MLFLVVSTPRPDRPSELAGARNEALHQILNEWADIIPAHFDTYPLVYVERARELLASHAAAASKGG